MILIEHISSFWTIVINGTPTLACVSFESAIFWMEQLTQEMDICA